MPACSWDSKKAYMPMRSRPICGWPRAAAGRFRRNDMSMSGRCANTITYLFPPGPSTVRDVTLRGSGNQRYPIYFYVQIMGLGRLGLDGEPRTIHLSYGLENIQWDRTSRWVERELINRLRPIAQGECWREESTGLHESQFIETRRHWFTRSVFHDTHDFR